MLDRNVHHNQSTCQLELALAASSHSCPQPPSGPSRHPAWQGQGRMDSGLGAGFPFGTLPAGLSKLIPDCSDDDEYVRAQWTRNSPLQ